MGAVDGSNGRSRGGMRNSLANLRPLGPMVMSVRNLAEDRRRAQEMTELGFDDMGSTDVVVAETEELCAYYERLHPHNARHWRGAVELVKAHAQGTAHGLDVVRRWGFDEHEQLGVAMPDWWHGKMVVPLEFMDYGPEAYSDEGLRAAGVDPARFHALAQRASERAWMGYYRAKGRLNSGGVSLLIKDVTDSALRLLARVERPSSPQLIYVIGISEDEVVALTRPDTCVIGFNRGHSPVVAKLVRTGRVTLLDSEGGVGRDARLVHADSREPFRPVGGRCFLCPGDVKHGLPVPDASGIAMTNYTLHHNDFDDQATMIREMHRTALPVRGGGRAWVAGEMIRNAHFIPTLFGPVSTIGPTVWDAWVSFANGVVTVNHHMARREAWADEGIRMRFTEVPGPLASAPSLVHRLLMPPTKVLISGC